MSPNEGGTASPEPEPKIIGLTGGIASGKTTVAQWIEAMGFPVYYSDQQAKDLVNKDLGLKQKIKNLLGEAAYNTEGLYDRKYVSSKVFENKALLEQLNQLIHPAVKTDFQTWLKQQNNHQIIFKETALLFELGLDRDCDKTLLVTAEDNLRMKRVMDRDGKTYREVENIMNKQMPEKDKLKRADFVIHNNSTLENLKQETLNAIAKITEEFL
ncbi:dephospho-CoA kinase [Bergeyella sp. RCAD1439]|uniref:dephospho-CoA kinase n=1 Tax=Bergeyella anatis TaxID=3113737 RepID=UPI002E19A97F|nr:dephospho-CoA kinase [Bergeyella sp. RCAD1439]MEC5394460.1 dephospho-CoA kinase [Bergeyella sp. RCAD1439]